LKDFTGMNEIVACPHPFKTDRVDMAVPDGYTVAQILALVQPREELREHAHVFIGDRLIESAKWETVKPLAGEKLTIRMVPAGGGGGKNPLATVLSIAVLAGAFYLGPLATMRPSSRGGDGANMLQPWNMRG
jgi:hypothetical protein